MSSGNLSLTQGTLDNKLKYVKICLFGGTEPTATHHESPNALRNGRYIGFKVREIEKRDRVGSRPTVLISISI